MEEEEVAYCICRTSDTNRFMIGCDNCNEWYHGDCISITEDLAKKILKFYCLLCRNKDPSLQIRFKEKKTGKKEKIESTLLVCNSFVTSTFVLSTCFVTFCLS
jgi:cpG-binding protein